MVAYLSLILKIFTLYLYPLRDLLSEIFYFLKLLLE